MSGSEEDTGRFLNFGGDQEARGLDQWENIFGNRRIKKAPKHFEKLTENENSTFRLLLLHCKRLSKEIFIMKLQEMKKLMLDILCPFQ